MNPRLFNSNNIDAETESYNDWLTEKIREGLTKTLPEYLPYVGRATLELTPDTTLQIKMPLDQSHLKPHESYHFTKKFTKLFSKSAIEDDNVGCFRITVDKDVILEMAAEDYSAFLQCCFTKGLGLEIPTDKYHPLPANISQIMTGTPTHRNCFQ